jgi:hypothetical protein
MKFTPARGTRLQRLLMVSVAGGTLRHDLEPSQPPRTRPSLGEVLAALTIFATMVGAWVLLP